MKNKIEKLNTFKNKENLSFASKTVLLVEDNVTHQNLMTQIITTHGFALLYAENGIVAIDKLKNNPDIDLIIMDWEMPIMDGLETTKTIRALEAKNDWKRHPILGFTSNKNKGDYERCLAAGMDAYLGKEVWLPKWRDLLIQKLDEILNHQEAFLAPSPLTQASPHPPILNTADNKYDMDTIKQAKYLLKNSYPDAVKDFIEDADIYVEKIRYGFKEDNYDIIVQGAHPLKSSSKSMGMIALSGIAEKIEHFARQKGNAGTPPYPDLDTLLERIEHELKDATSFMETLLTDHTFGGIS